jgi:hypothetical protein
MVNTERERVIKDGNRITCAGAISSFDLALLIISKHLGQSSKVDLEAFFMHQNTAQFVDTPLQNGDYGDKRACNTRIGPGGGTRRLHQNPSFEGSWGRNRIDGRLKMLAFTRRTATVIGVKCTVANDNRAPVAVAA